MKKFISLLALLSFLSSAHAQSFLNSSFFEMTEMQNYSFPWDEKDRSALVLFIDPVRDDKSGFANLIVAMNKSGKKGFFINVRSDGSSICSPKVKSIDSLIVEFDGRPIKFIAFCSKYSDSENHYLSITPETDKGLDFIVKKLIIPKKSYNVSFYGLSFGVSSQNFKPVWDSLASEAL